MLRRRLLRKLSMAFIKNPSMKCFLEDCLIPFMLGFFTILLIFWVQAKLTEETFEPVETFRDDSGQVYLKRHGVQERVEDLQRQIPNLGLSQVAMASNGFKPSHIRTKVLRGTVDVIKDGNGNIIGIDESADPIDPVGAIWSWPRLEKMSNNDVLVWVVTPTYRNPYQYAELTRIAQALYPARKFVRWLVVDDSSKSKGHPKHIPRLKAFLEPFKIVFWVLKSKPRDNAQPVMFTPKGVDARRTAIAFIRKRKLKGVVYFADDDNAYDSDIFRQMQSTKTVSVWPTGAITQWIISGPVVNTSGVVVDFFDAFTANRKFPVDFASFAVNTKLLHKNRNANIPWIQGYEETIFLRTLNVNKNQFQVLAANATEVLTWHTKTLKDYHLRDNTMLQRLLQQKSHWPNPVRKLLDKYDFLFEPVKKESSSKSQGSIIHYREPEIPALPRPKKMSNSELSDSVNEITPTQGKITDSQFQTKNQSVLSTQGKRTLVRTRSQRLKLPKRLPLLESPRPRSQAEEPIAFVKEVKE